jgi:hypothetical protein
MVGPAPLWVSPKVFFIIGLQSYKATKLTLQPNEGYVNKKISFFKWMHSDTGDEKITDREREARSYDKELWIFW